MRVKLVVYKLAFVRWFVLAVSGWTALPGNLFHVLVVAVECECIMGSFLCLCAIDERCVRKNREVGGTLA